MLVLVIRTAIALVIGCGVAEAQDVRQLRGQLEGPDEVARTAANKLGKMGPAAAEAVPSLIWTLTRPDVFSDQRASGVTYHEGTIRSNAAWALGRIGAAAASAIPALCSTAARGGNSLYGEANPINSGKHDEYQAAIAIGAIVRAGVPKTTADKAVSCLIRAVAGARNAGAAGAARSLSQLGQMAQPAIPQLQNCKASSGRDEDVKSACASALMAIRGF
jgi:hypothetical protein